MPSISELQAALSRGELYEVCHELSQMQDRFTPTYKESLVLLLARKAGLIQEQAAGGSKPKELEEKQNRLKEDLAAFLNVLLDLEEQGKPELWARRSVPENDASPGLPKHLTTQVPVVMEREIVGRDAELLHLRKRLTQNKKVQLLNGMGGIGKTTLAARYATQYRDEYAHIAWFTQENTDFRIDLVQSMGLLVRLDIQAEGKGFEVLFHEVIHRLTSLKARPCLLIIDNALPSLAQLADSLPRPPHWHVLVTAREKIDRLEPFELNFLSPEAAYALFELHYSRKKISPDQIKTLVQAVDFHTLTIEILAKTAQRRRLNFTKLEAALGEDLPSRVHTHHREKQVDRVTSYLRSIFNLTGMNATETWVLKQFACLPPEFHTYELIEELTGPAAYGHEELFSETLEGLAEKGWLLYKEETDEFKMHRVVVEVVLAEWGVRIDEAEVLVKRVGEKLEVDYERSNQLEKIDWLPFGISVHNAMGEEVSGELAHLLNELGSVSKYVADLNGAKIYYLRSLEIDQEILPSNDLGIGIKMSNLGNVLRRLGETRRAVDFQAKALSIGKKNLEQNDPKLATLFSNLALSFKDLQKLDRAQDLLEKAIEIDNYCFPYNHPGRTNKISNLGIVLKLKGELNRSKVLLENALEIDEDVHGSDHPKLAVRFSNLATVLMDMGELNDAKRLLRRALSIDQKYLDDDHPHTNVSKGNLSKVLFALGETEEAHRLKLEAYNNFKDKLGKDHSKTRHAAEWLQKIQAALDAQNKPSKSAP